jgi:hypothetical protein
MTITNERALRTWAATRLHVWPDEYLLVSVPRERAAEAAGVVGAVTGFAALVVERDEVSLSLPRPAWAVAAPRFPEARVEGPFTALTLDIDIELGVCGYLAPAAERLAEAGVSIVPQCAFLKDHLLVPATQAGLARQVLEGLIAEAARALAAEQGGRPPLS